MRRLSLLCRTLSENRVLARGVRKLDIYLDALDGGTIRLPPPLDVNCLRMMVEADLGLTSAQQEKFWEWLARQCAYGMTYPEDEDMDDDDDSEEEGGRANPDVPDGLLGPEIYLGILMVACPQLQYLRLEGDYSRLSRIARLNEALRFGSTQSSSTTGTFADGLGNLPEVYFANRGEENEDDEPMGPYLLFPVLTWPSLQKISLGRLGDPETPLAELDFGISSKLKELRIEAAFVEDVGHQLLLAECPKLKSFSFAWSWTSDVYRMADWRSIAEVLIDRNPWLEELHLDIAHRAGLRDRIVINAGEWEVMDEVERSRAFEVNNIGLGDLTELRHLRKLSAPKIALFGVFDNPVQRDREWTLADILPSKVQEVEIFCEGVDFTEDDRELLTSPGTARLQDITIFNCTRDKWISKKRGEGSVQEV